MKQNQETDPVIYTIPSNFIESGRILNGMFKTRNFIEAVIVIVVLFLILNLIPFSATSTKIAVMVGVIGPFALVCLTGINDETAFTFVSSMFKWRKKRKIMLYNRNQEVQRMRALEALMAKKTSRAVLTKYIESWKANKEAAIIGDVLIEGETFQFARDADTEEINAEARRLARPAEQQKKDGTVADAKDTPLVLQLDLKSIIGEGFED